MRAYYSDVFALPLPEGHRFPVDKYRLLRLRVAEFADACGIRLVEAPAAEISELALAHTEEYLRKVCQGGLTDLEQRRIGFPWSEAMVRRCRHSAGGTLAAARSALEDGIGVHLAGGTHHAFADAGQGFCVFNDVAVATRVLTAQGLMRRAVVIDCDVHQGNGTASMFAGDDRLFTFSMHGDRNFPFRKCEGDLDIALADGTGDEPYLNILREVVRDRLPLDGADCVFYLAGADPYVYDRFGRLALTKVGLAARDQVVLDACRRRGIPLVVVMAGGYAANLDDIVDIHAKTVQLAAM
jgi:acetoin utilization deacetylase AcuC-like enzyme